MPDYATMYRRLFQSQTKAIDLLQRAQQETEEMYISAPEPELFILREQEDSADANDSEEDGK